MRKIIATLTLAAAAAACSANSPVTPGARPPAGSPTASPSTTPSAAPGKTTVTIYYLVSGASDLYLAPERHDVDKTPAIAKAALDELLAQNAQDEDHTVPFAKSAKVNSVVIKDKVATVDWNADVLTSGGGGDIEALAIQSIVYTLTEFPTIAKVRFTVEGKDSGTASNGKRIDDFWGHVGLGGQPWDRDPAIDVLEPITLWTPLEGASSTGSLKLAGLASTFEANVAIFLRDAKGKIVVQTSTTAVGGGAPARSPFEKTISFNPPTSTQQWTVQVVEHSMEDGSVFFMEDRTITVG